MKTGRNFHFTYFVSTIVWHCPLIRKISYISTSFIFQWKIGYSEMNFFFLKCFTIQKLILRRCKYYISYQWAGEELAHLFESNMVALVIDGMLDGIRQWDDYSWGQFFRRWIAFLDYFIDVMERNIFKLHLELEIEKQDQILWLIKIMQRLFFVLGCIGHNW